MPRSMRTDFKKNYIRQSLTVQLLYKAVYPLGPSLSKGSLWVLGLAEINLEAQILL